MIRQIVKDPFFLQQISKQATKEDLPIGKDLQDTLSFHREHCLGLAANMIGESKRVIIISMGFVDILMFNPKLVKKPIHMSLKNLASRFQEIRRHNVTKKLQWNILILTGEKRV